MIGKHENGAYSDAKLTFLVSPCARTLQTAGYFASTFCTEKPAIKINNNIVGWLYEKSARIFNEGYVATEGLENFKSQFMDGTIDDIGYDEGAEQQFATDGSYNEDGERKKL